MGFVMWDPTVTVISAVIASLTPIAARRAVFYMPASFWVLVLVVISVATTQSIIMSA